MSEICQEMTRTYEATTNQAKSKMDRAKFDWNRGRGATASASRQLWEGTGQMPFALRSRPQKNRHCADIQREL